MALPVYPLFQRQLDTILQLVVLLLSTMTAEEVVLIRMHLNKAVLALGNVVVNGAANNNGNVVSTLLLA
jgi:hypothetical protein